MASVLLLYRFLICAPFFFFFFPRDAVCLFLHMFLPLGRTPALATPHGPPFYIHIHIYPQTHIYPLRGGCLRSWLWMMTVQSRDRTDNASVSTFDSATFLDFIFWIDSSDFDASSCFSCFMMSYFHVISSLLWRTTMTWYDRWYIMFIDFRMRDFCIQLLLHRLYPYLLGYIPLPNDIKGFLG